MSELLKKYDAWIQNDGPAALVIREHLVPVEGSDGVFFPATFASGDGFAGGYNIDEFPDGSNVCLVDSVGSQANRIEPLFAMDAYAGLVPQVVIKAGDKRVNLLEAGHRAGDAIIRCSSLQVRLHDAFRSSQKGDAEPLAQIAPTSLVFGVWDSRDTQAKAPRLIASTIRAFNVRRLTRSAQFVPATEYVENGLLEEASDKKAKDVYAKRGFIHVPASASHGGVIATAGIRREAVLHLAAVRLLSASNAERTVSLRRYILGLALTAFTFTSTGFLRQGCSLVLDIEKRRELKEIHGDGRREDLALRHDEAVEFAKCAAKAFGIDPKRDMKSPDTEVEFDRELAKSDVSLEDGEGAKKTKKVGARK